MLQPAPTPSFIVASRSNPHLNAQHILHGYTQFNAGNYDEAMMFFQLTEAEPLQILSLFPDVLPSGLVQQQQQQQAGEAAGGPGADALASSPFASLPPLAAQKHPVAVQKVQGEERLFRALSALIPYLAQIQNRLRLSLEPLFAGNRRTVDDDQAAMPKRKAAQQQQQQAQAGPKDHDLALAILVDTVLLKAYLLCDIPLLPFLSSPYNLCDIDECANILRAYEKYHELIAFYKFRARHGQALELLASLGQMSAPKNKSAGGSGAHSSQSLQPAAANSSSLAGLSGTEPTIKYLQELAVNIHQPCYPAGMGDASSPSNSSALPSQFSPALSLDPNPDTIIALILHFSKWVTAADVDDGLRIFTFCHTMNMRPVEAKRKDAGASPSLTQHALIHSYAHHKEHCVPSHVVLEHLKKIADREACIAYLESLINHVGETDALFHNELVFLYLESIQKLLRAREQRESALKNGTPISPSDTEQLDSVAEVPVRARGSSVAARGRGSVSVPSSSEPSAAAPPSAVATRDSSRLHILRRKLLEFLRSSVSYTAEKMLSRFPRHALLEERAILLSRINQHTQALNIYAHSLHDPLQAEAYAEEYYRQATQAQAQQQAHAQLANGSVDGASSAAAPISSAAIAQGRDMYLNLLQVYLKPPVGDSVERSSVLAGQQGLADGAPVEPPAPMLDAALMLLSRYYDRISPVQALEALPAETPLQALWPYFEKLLCHTCHTHRDEQITKQLLKTEYYSVREQYLLASRGRVAVDQHTNCGKCMKKLGNSAFARYPNGQIVHYVCHQLSLQGQAQNAGLQGVL